MEPLVLLEDNHLIVCVKPSGILSQAGEMDIPDMVNILKGYLKEKYNKPGNVYLGLVHRLDLNVSGVMVFAKTSKAASRLSEQIKSHSFTKKYLAIVKGVFNSNEGFLEDYIRKDEKLRQAFLANSKTGKLAKLQYSVLGTNIIDEDVYSLVDINLLSGRFHQIRFQFANAGHPLLKDTKYGKMIENKDFFIGLYSYQIEFNHPVTKEELVFNHKPNDIYFRKYKELDLINWR